MMVSYSPSFSYKTESEDGIFINAEYAEDQLQFQEAPTASFFDQL
jgi:hypothetical protein